MKQLRFLLLLLLMSALSITMDAANNNDRFTVNGITYRISNITAHEVDFEGTNKSGNIVIPQTVKDSVNIEWKVISVYYGKCPNMTSVTIPNTVRKIYEGAFGDSKLTSITIPQSVTEIEDGVFSNCTSLTEINVASGNTSFYSHEGVLYGKNNGTPKRLIQYPIAKTGGTYSVPEGVVSIAKRAFQACKFLKTLSLPKSLSNIEKDLVSSWAQEVSPFVYSWSISKIEVAAGNTTYKSVDGVVLTADGKQLVVCPVGKTGDVNGLYTIPNGVEIITNVAFSTNIKIKKLIFPTTLKEIKPYAFYRCYELMTVTIPKSVTEIGVSAFSACEKLTEINVENGNSKYDSYNGVLYNASGTELLNCPAGKTGEYTTKASTITIKEGAFSLCKKITKVTVSNKVQAIESAAFNSTEAMKQIVFATTSSLKEIKGDKVFTSSGIEKIDLPASLEVIGEGVFNSAKKLKEVTIAANSNLQKIENLAFYHAENLTSFKFLGSCKLQTIGSNAFAQAKKLQSFAFPKSVTKIGQSAFNGC